MEVENEINHIRRHLSNLFSNTNNLSSEFYKAKEEFNGNYFKLVKIMEKLPKSGDYRRLDVKIENLTSELKKFGLDSSLKINLVEEFQIIKEDVEENQENVGIIIDKLVKMRKESSNLIIFYVIFAIIFLFIIFLLILFLKLKSQVNSLTHSNPENETFCSHCSVINHQDMNRVNSLYYSKTSLLHKLPNNFKERPNIEVRSYEIPKVKYSNTYEELVDPTKYENIERIYAIPNNK